MTELLIICPECHENAAVQLGELAGVSLYACVRCDAEFSVETDPDD